MSHTAKGLKTYVLNTESHKFNTDKINSILHNCHDLQDFSVTSGTVAFSG